MRYTHFLLTAFAIAAVSCNNSTKPLVYDCENSGAQLEKIAYIDPAKLPVYDALPDPFAWSDKKGRSTKFSDWEKRRNQIKSEIEFYEIGVKPDKPENITASVADSILTVIVEHNGKKVTLTSKIKLPTGEGPFPVSIGMGRFSGTGSLKREMFPNFIQIPFDHDQVAKYSMNQRDTSYPFYQMYPELSGNGNYSAWAWGVSRIIDGLEIVADELNADLSHILVTGCSYAGKMALYSSAFDERIALAIVQESGGGGINSWRVSEEYTARTDTNVERICNTNYTWFMPALKTHFDGKANQLPFDHHELIAMCAPRAVLVLGNGDYEWLCDYSGYISCRAAEVVYNTFGIADRFGYVFDTKHPHCRASEAQNKAIKAFVDKFIFNDLSVNPTIREATPHLNSINYKKWIDGWAK